MTETYPSDAELNDLSGTTDPEQEVLFVPIGESPYYTSFYKMLHRLLNVSRRAGDLRVYKDVDEGLTCGVRPGRWMNGDQLVEFDNTEGVTLENNTTNYIYVEMDGTLHSEPNDNGYTSFPVPSVTPHKRLAVIETSAGDYDGRDSAQGGDITDMRGTIFSGPAGSAAQRKLRDYQDSVADELNFTTSEPSSPSVGDRYINTATGTSSETSQSVTANYIYEWNGTSWTEAVPDEGFWTTVEDRDMVVYFDGTAWTDVGSGALLNESQQFFNATDISGSEAETLTDGSNADSLHVHGVNGLEAAVAGDGLQGGAGSALAVDVSDFAGTGLEDDGAENLRIAATAAGDGLTGGAGSALAVNVDDSTIEIATDTVQAKDGGITVAKLASAVQDLLPNLNITSGGEVGDTHTVTIQARDAADNNLAERFLIQLWVDDAEYGAPDATGNTVAVTTGTTCETVTVNAHYTVISDANGKVIITLAVAGDATRYVMAEVDGRIYSSGALSFTA